MTTGDGSAINAPGVLKLAESVLTEVVMVIGDQWKGLPDDTKQDVKQLIGEYYYWQMQHIQAKFDQTIDGERAKENAALAAAGLDCLGEVLAPKVREAMMSLLIGVLKTAVTTVIL